MAVTQRTLIGSGKDKVLVILTTIDTTDVTAQVIYDNSAFVNDVSKGNLMGYMVSGSDSLVRLFWDQTTDSPIVSLNPINSPKAKLGSFGGIPNPSGTGATGDIVVTTTGLGAGKAITIILWINQI